MGLANNAPFGALERAHQEHDMLTVRKIGLELLNRLLQRVALAIDHTIGPAQLVNALFGEAAALEAFDIQSMCLCGLP